MKMNRIIPVILVTVVLVTGSLVNAYSLNTSGKLRLDSKKNFLVSSAESIPGNTNDNTIFESYKGTIASSEVIRMDAYSGSTITPYYFHTNEIGSTTAVTDANGNVVERYKYSLYGMPTFMDAAGNVIPNSTIGNNILFQGREYEPETNFYYFRARHLDPIMGRFLQTAPMGYEDSLNLYQAFNQNPVNFRDPFGRSHVGPSIVPCYSAAKKCNPAIARIYERVSTAAIMALGGGITAKIIGIKATISALLTMNITSTLDETVERRKAGQTPEQVNKAVAARLLMFGPFYKIITGKYFGTQQRVSIEDRVATTGEVIVGTLGFIFGYNATRSNPSTFQLMDDAFSVLDFRKTSTGYVAITKYNPNEVAASLEPIEITFELSARAARNMTKAQKEDFIAHLAEQEAELNMLSLHRKSDLELNLLNYKNISDLGIVDAARKTASIRLGGVGSGLHAAHKLDAVAGGYVYNIPYLRDAVQSIIGSLWKSRVKYIISGRIHKLIPVIPK